VILRQWSILSHAGPTLLGINRKRRDEDIPIDVSFKNLRRVAHPGGQRRRIIDDDIPLTTFKRVELAVTVADQLLNFFWQFAGMRSAAIENRDLVAASERVLDLKRTNKTRAAEDQNAHRLH